jgi:hypothetical protein
MSRNRLLSFVLVGLCSGFAAALGSGCSHTEDAPKTLSQQRSALIGEPAPAGALNQYMAQHPKLHVIVPPKK